MLAVKITEKRKVYVSFCDDTHPNKGGYYCQVYADENGEFELDNFVIHRNELPICQDANERLKKAYIVANAKVKSMFK